MLVNEVFHTNEAVCTLNPFNVIFPTIAYSFPNVSEVGLSSKSMWKVYQLNMEGFSLFGFFFSLRKFLIH